MNYTSIDWFYGICYVPNLMERLRMANPAIGEENLRAVFSVLPTLSEEELSDTSTPSHRVVDISLGKTSSYYDIGEDYLERPLNLSVACFDREVLARYNVSMDGSLVRCDDWLLRDVYTNSAGQVHVCISDLEQLPIDEQEHWKKYNVTPDLERDRGRVAPPFQGMAGVFVNRCLFNSWSQ